MSDDAEILNLANSTGFLFQIGVGRQIDLTTREHGWEVVAQEHRWSHHLTDQTGFADLVLGHKEWTLRIVIECKRATDREWVFLTPSPSTKTKARASAFIFYNTADPEVGGGWLDLSLEPYSPESAFCVVRGQDERNTPMLERIADSLLPSTEAIARENAHLQKTTRPDLFPPFIPIVVTNASLVTCTFDPASVDLTQGKVPASEAKFAGVDVIRFRKALATNYPGADVPRSLAEANRYGERTMFVVNASALSDFLTKFAPHPDSGTALRRLVEAGKRARPYV